MLAIGGAILAWIAESWLGKWLLQYGIKQLAEFIRSYFEKRAEQRAAKKKADESVQKLKDAKTPQEVEDATDDALDGV